VLLELKSAVTEALVDRFHLESEPTTAAIIRALRNSRAIPPALLQEFEGVLRHMQSAEAIILAGRQLRVGREVVAQASRVVEEILRITSEDHAMKQTNEAEKIPGLGNGKLTS
jgi:hypothetical protein